MNDQERFQAFCKKRFKAEALDTATGHDNVHLFHTSLSSFQNHMNWTKGARNKRQSRLDIVPGFIETMQPNAVADFMDKTHFAGMHSSLFVAINEFTMFCFTQREFFPGIGDPSVENSPQPADERAPGLWLIDRTKRGQRVESTHSETLTPRDQERYDASIHLALLMARFVWMHELSHCFNGHVDYVQDKDLALFLCELPMEVVGFSKPKFKGTSSEKDKILHCLEFDADKSAFWASCRIQTDNLENVEGIAKRDLKTRLLLTMFGAYAMTWMFEEFQNYLGTQDGRSHPKPYFRLQNLFRTTASQLAPLVENISDINFEACSQFDAIKGAIKNIYHAKTLFDDLQDAGLQAEVTEFDKQLLDLKSELVGYEYSQKPR